MGKKILKLLLGIVLVTGSILPVSARDKSVQAINDSEAVTNNGSRLEIIYEDQQAFVYYGSTGINIITAERTVHLPTNFEVLKMADVGDIDHDGYADFMTYQKVPEFAAQLIVVSGNDGHVISSVHLDRDSYSDALGFIRANSYIQQILPFDGNTCLVVYDYSVVKVDLASGEKLAEYTSTDNLWKAVLIDDINQDGVADIAAAGQDNTVVLVSGEDGSELNVYHPANVHTIDLRNWGQEGSTVDAVMNIWDLYYELGTLYALSEDGNVIMINPAVAPAVNMPEEQTFIMYPLNVVSEEQLQMRMQNQLRWEESGIRYNPTGVTRWNYRGYRFAQITDEYFLIDCFMGDPDSAYEYQDGMYISTVVLFDRATGEVSLSQPLDYFSSRYVRSCLGEYEGGKCVATVLSTGEGSVRIGVYSVTGELLNQKELTLRIGQGEQQMELSWVNDRYLLQVYNGSCVYISADLKQIEYCYDSVTSSLLAADEESVMFLYSNNGIKNRITKLASNLTDVIWEYTLNVSYANKGIEYITTEYDFNKDGINDIMMLVNKYNKDGYAEATYYIIIDSNGNVHRNNCVITSTYWEGGVKKTIYLTASKIALANDYDGDGTKEIVMDGNVIGSRKNQVIGSLSGYLDAKGTPFEIGDLNKDGVTDYVVFNGSEARNYQSRVRYSYGYVSVEYTKTSTTRWLDTKLDPVNTSKIIGDINNDGTNEIGMIGRNQEGREIYKIVDGRTLKDIANLYEETGIKDYGEGVKVLPFDLNGDGYNELYVRYWWNPWIADGATGKMLLCTALYYDEEEQFYGEDNYFPDYLVPFYEMEDEQSFVVINDVNGDSSPEIAFPRITYDRTSYQELANVLIVNGSDQQVIRAIPFEVDYRSPISTVQSIENSENYFLFSGSKNAMVVDIEKGKVLATYDLNIKKAYQYDENTLFAETVDGLLYSVDIQKSFTLTSEMPETTPDHVLDISWEGLQDFSIMTISDNGTAVYSGQDSRTSVQLTEGKHSIILSMNDGQGKTYQESYEVTVEPQPKSFVAEAAIAAVLLIISFLCGVFQKIWFNRRFKKEVAGK